MNPSRLLSDSNPSNPTYLAQYKNVSSDFEKKIAILCKAKAIANHFAWFSTQPSLEFRSLQAYLHSQLRFILSQVEEPLSAPMLQLSLLALSARITSEVSFQNPAGHRLGSDVTGYALGIFNSGEKPDWDELPLDMLEKEIFPKLVHKKSTLTQMLVTSESIMHVSKRWYATFEQLRLKCIGWTEEMKRVKAESYLPLPKEWVTLDRVHRNPEAKKFLISR